MKSEQNATERILLQEDGGIIIQNTRLQCLGKLFKAKLTSLDVYLVIKQFSSCQTCFYNHRYLLTSKYTERDCTVC